MGLFTEAMEDEVVARHSLLPCHWNTIVYRSLAVASPKVFKLDQLVHFTEPTNKIRKWAKTEPKTFQFQLGREQPVSWAFVSAQDECRVSRQLVALAQSCLSLRADGHRELQRLNEAVETNLTRGGDENRRCCELKAIEQQEDR